MPYGATCGFHANSTGLHGDHDVVTAVGRGGWSFSRKLLTTVPLLATSNLVAFLHASDLLTATLSLPGPSVLN